MELQRLCAYNQTRECFLGLEVAAADFFSYASLKDMLPKLELKSGEGLLIKPFKGIPETDMLEPLDLIYLDEDCRVIEVVESFPTFCVTPFSPQTASVLALPTHSIYSSQTQQGDQLVLCAAEEMQNKLERFCTPSGIEDTARKAKPFLSGVSGVTQGNNSSEGEYSESERPYKSGLDEPAVQDIKPSKNWLERWWSPYPKISPDMRKSPRETVPGVAVYYWTGATPSAHSVRDISLTGMYVVTEERWYPGTLILMTIQPEGCGGQEGVECSIAVQSRAVRWGSDGVGFQFILQDAPAASKGEHPLAHGVDQNELDRFLSLLLKGKS
jgi:hypothetical protein